MKNKFIMESDNRRTYHFDRKSGRLEGLEIHLREKDREVLIFEVTEIEYNQPIDPKVFTLELPDDVIFERAAIRGWAVFEFRQTLIVNHREYLDQLPVFSVVQHHMEFIGSDHLRCLSIN